MSVKPEKLKKVEKVGNYFLDSKKTLSCIPSGCTLLDLVLGGGWAIGRVSNVVGDASTGKSLLAIEACANFNKIYPKGDIWYHEVESAFDQSYAEALGMPVDNIEFVADTYKDFDTVEGLFSYFVDVVFKRKSKEPGLYILDTQDFLTDNAEKTRDIDKGTYGQDKNKILQVLYRRHIREIENSRVHFMIISQTRDNIGVTFGRKWRVTGDGAMKFAASQRLQLAEKSQMKDTHRGVTSSYGAEIVANCFKNKVGLPHRSCVFPLYYGFGIDTNQASLEFLKKTNGLEGLGVGEGYSYKDIQELSREELNVLIIRELGIENPDALARSEARQRLCDKWELQPRSRKRSPGGIDALCAQLRERPDPDMEKKIKDRTVEVWNEIETHFLPGRRKYD